MSTQDAESVKLIRDAAREALVYRERFGTEARPVSPHAAVALSAQVSGQMDLGLASTIHEVSMVTVITGLPVPTEEEALLLLRSCRRNPSIRLEDGFE